MAENANQPARPNQDRQHELAEGCDTTIVTESAPFIYTRGGELLRNASDQVFLNRPTRYDLLSVPSLRHLMKEPAWIDLLAKDILATVGLHYVEKVLVAALTIQPRPLIQRLREIRDIRERLRLGGFSPQQPTTRTDDSRTVALTCMDWRLHGPGGFGPHFARLYNVSGFSVFATAGAAKDLACEGPRLHMVLSQLEVVANKTDTLVLMSHTDCGRYGGSRAFASPEAELRQLTDDLEAAKARIAAAFPKLKIKTAIARTKGTRCLAVMPIGA